MLTWRLKQRPLANPVATVNVGKEHFCKPQISSNLTFLYVATYLFFVATNCPEISLEMLKLQLWSSARQP